MKYYLKVLWSCLGAVENTHLKLNQFITPMDPYPYAKKYLHTLSLWMIILKHFSIKALALGIPWHNLDKKPHWFVTPMEKECLKPFPSYWNFKDLGIWLIETKLGMLTITKQKYLNNFLALRMSSHMIVFRYVFNIACSISIEFSKVLQSDWLRKPLATCKNSQKSKIFPMQLFTAKQKNREMTGQTENKYFTVLPWFFKSPHIRFSSLPKNFEYLPP